MDTTKVIFVFLAKVIFVFLVVAFYVVVIPIALLESINLIFGDIVDYTLRTWFGALVNCHYP